MKIALITTLPSLIENKRLADEAGQMGHEFMIVNLKDFSFQIKNGMLDAPELTGLEADIAILRGVFVSIKTISAIVTKMRENGLKVFDNNFLKHRYSIDKVTDLTKLSLAGIPVPDTSYSRDIEDFPRLADELGFSVIVKSTRMGKGAQIFKVDDMEELEEFMEDIQNQGKKAKNYLIQQFIPYVHDLRALVIGNQVFTMKRIPAEDEFRANFSLGGSVEPYELDQEGRQLAIKALNSIDMTIGGVDILIDGNNDRYILEVNHTAGFVGMEKALSQNIGKVWLKEAINRAK